MPIKTEGHAHHLVRRAKTVRGELSFRMICAPAFDYGRASHKVEMQRGEVLFTSEATDGLALRLRTSVPVKIENGAAVAEFKLAAGETAAFVLENAAESHGGAGNPDYVAAAFKETMNFWRGWIRKSSYKGRWREMVNRSALALKLLTYAPTGAVVAAPTFGLPEEIGGGRNWDYRYTWIRDASFTIYGLMRLGYTEEAAAFMSWIENRCHELKPDGALKIMYGMDGRHELIEETLPHLGRLSPAPLRFGSAMAPAAQLQLDIYGELMDSVYLYNKFGEPISYDLWQISSG